jgi:hypothetical protein
LTKFLFLDDLYVVSGRALQLTQRCRCGLFVHLCYSVQLLAWGYSSCQCHYNEAFVLHSQVELDQEEEEEIEEGNHSVLRALRDGYLQEISRSEEAKRRCTTKNAKHDYYKKTRCTSVAEEEQSATPWGVKNVCFDSDDEDGYSCEQAEIQAESDELRATRSAINPPGLGYTFRCSQLARMVRLSICANQWTLQAVLSLGSRSRKF